MPLIFPSNTLSAGGYTVDNSCRFNRGDQPNLSRTLGTPTNSKIWTFSFWYKRNPGTSQMVINSESSTSYMYFVSDTLSIEQYDSSYQYQLTTTRVFRDLSAWMHFCVAMDTTQGTDTNRLKLYVNGTQETVFSTATYPAEDLETNFNSAVAHVISLGGTNALDGYLAEVCLIDGTAYAASDFGEFDEDSPTIWKPKNVSGLTFGNNGFYFDFEDSSNLGNDANGGTDWTVANLAAADQATDTPTNNFCTMNPLGNYVGYFSEANQSALVFTEGNNFVGKCTHGTYVGTMATNKMKFYFEAKPTDTNTYLGIISIEPTGSGGDHINKDVTANTYYPYSNKVWVDGEDDGSGDFDNTQSQIYMFAVDPTNNKMWYGRGGTWTGDPAAGSGETWDSLPANTLWTPLINPNATTQENDTACNFGGCSAFDISSGNADGNGYGNFEYAVPSGFYALCTKNLAEYG